MRTAAAQEHAWLLDAGRRLGVVGVYAHEARHFRGGDIARLWQGSRRQRGRIVRRRTGVEVHGGRHGALPELQDARNRPVDVRQTGALHANGEAEEEGRCRSDGFARGDVAVGGEVSASSIFSFLVDTW